ncbi:sulfurtransferase-like selenium metabolism protein YedF [Desulforamulus hydrothermalis]|uniref:Selenium metabolism protein YedF n=1 Tax=Desulforamulus hydrothermalis Lam5 = DSM 18033 TaxID=1121428 RepID=K8E0N7_9FIRM|nr:sulfurtransferase-like selenium metabolism protein YedF [Desulforamulus hydrothermalis]CCO09070.1 Selenium metabolism protein YedF [Desulforamulus hydrothermalis Lam5 = DSM 18033]SHG78336.1 tRNA 2-thiouridine synthesizing protein A [Desulforamulus hydrothermalis Lam5 = DSM 18033]
MIREINNRGLACPQPVINTKRALDEIQQGTVISVVDNRVALENVTRFAENAGCQVNVEEKNGEFYITITKGEAAAGTVLTMPDRCRTGSVVYLITGNTFGSGAEDLGEVLMVSFFNSLLEKPAPRLIMLVNSGVRLAVQHSRVLDQITRLAERGTEVLACGTCLDYYKLKDQLAVGRVTNMLEILENLTGGDQVITL